MQYLQKEKNQMYQKMKIQREIRLIKDALDATNLHKKRLLYQLTTLKVKLRGLEVKK